MSAPGHEIAAGSVAAFYDEQLATYGDDLRSNGWKDAAYQRRQFDAVAAAFAHERGAFTVYEVGCGLGDFSAYLRERFPAAQYAGCDLNPRMIAAAERRYPDVAVEVRDVVADPPPLHDYAVASGIFNIKGSVPDTEWSALVRSVLRAMFAIARKGIAATLLTSAVDFRHDVAYHQDPAELVRWAMADLSRFVRLDHRYWPWEFAIEIRHEPLASVNRPPTG
jgi:SAM-dependent methyltransferase